MSDQKRILLVEDEEHIRDAIKLILELEDYEVVIAKTGLEALKKFDGQHFDLVVLDIMLPEVDGLDVCQQIRLHNTQIPVIMVTAKDSGDDRIAGLKRGADDYLTKPFESEELLLRIHNLLKRTSKDPVLIGDEYTFGPNQVNFKTYEASNATDNFILTKKEALLLKLLIDRKGDVLSRQQILQSVWGYDVYPSTRTIDNFILSFRKYFEKDPKNPTYFHSIRGIGYKFSEPEE